MTRFALLTAALVNTTWARFGAVNAAVAALGPTPKLGPNDRIVGIQPIVVADNAVALYLGERVGNNLDGTAGFIQIPPDLDFKQLAGTTLTLGNQTITFLHTSGGASAGTIVNTFGKTRALVVAEVVALLTAGTTGIADLEIVDGVEDGAIVLQSDASSVVQAIWTAPEQGGVRLFAGGLAVAQGRSYPTGTYTGADRIDLRNSDVRAISLRGSANPSNSTWLLEIQSLEIGPLR